MVFMPRGCTSGAVTLVTLPSLACYPDRLRSRFRSRVTILAPILLSRRGRRRGFNERQAVVHILDANPVPTSIPLSATTARRSEPRAGASGPRDVFRTVPLVTFLNMRAAISRHTHHLPWAGLPDLGTRCTGTRGMLWLRSAKSVAPLHGTWIWRPNSGGGAPKNGFTAAVSAGSYRPGRELC